MVQEKFTCCNCLITTIHWYVHDHSWITALFGYSSCICDMQNVRVDLLWLLYHLSIMMSKMMIGSSHLCCAEQFQKIYFQWQFYLLLRWRRHYTQRVSYKDITCCSCPFCCYVITEYPWTPNEEYLSCLT